MTPEQARLPTAAPRAPEGLRYQADLISTAEEEALLRHLQGLPFEEFQFHGYLGKRRVVSFGWEYRFGEAALQPADPIPAFLLPLRERSAAFAELSPNRFPHVLITEYGTGAGIGWHRDKGVFGDVVGISLLSACPFRMRRKVGALWERVTLTAEPRSAYLLRGPARTEWEHSIAAVESLRYSITFRTLQSGR